ncbi:uncharacterized protein LOC142635932 [Castanea sativa]|uniref:uncharacterized protein LOC142635932 n=1 Tax=Castanea sativa TaxID=21020 RepID=UPI003F6548B8
MQVRFGTNAYDDPMEMLTRLRQTASVTTYKTQFEILSNRIKGFSPAHKLSCFLSGLKDEIRLPVRMLNPQSLNAAFGLAKIQEEYLISAFQAGKEGPKGFTMQNGLLLYKGRMYLRTCDSLKIAILQQVHDGPWGGHSGFLKTLHRVQRDFYWPGLRKDVRKYVRECDTCQRLKHETCNPTGLL